MKEFKDYTWPFRVATITDGTFRVVDKYNIPIITDIKFRIDAEIVVERVNKEFRPPFGTMTADGYLHRVTPAFARAIHEETKDAFDRELRYERHPEDDAKTRLFRCQKEVIDGIMGNICRVLRTYHDEFLAEQYEKESKK